MHARRTASAALVALVAASLPLLAPGTATATTAPLGTVRFSAQPTATWQADGEAWTVLGGTTGAAHGLVFVGGTFDHVRPPGTAVGDPAEAAAMNLAVLDADTGAPATLCSSFPGLDLSSNHLTSGVYALALSPDGNTLYVGGSFDEVAGGASTTSDVVALDLTSPTCAPRTDWQVSTHGTVRTITVTGSTVWLGGDFDSVTAPAGTVPRDHAAAVTTAGVVTPWHPTFTPDSDSNQPPQGTWPVTGGSTTTADYGTAPTYLSPSGDCVASDSATCAVAAGISGTLQTGRITFEADAPAGSSYTIALRDLDSSVDVASCVISSVTTRNHACDLNPALTAGGVPRSVVLGDPLVLVVTLTAGSTDFSGTVASTLTLSRYASTVHAVLPAPGGTTPGANGVLVAGAFLGADGLASRGLVLVDGSAGTTVRKAFTAIPANSVVKDVVSDGTSFYLAAEGTGSGVYDGRAAFRWSDGAQLWNDLCLGATQALALDNGVLYSASHAHDCSNNLALNEFPDGSRHHLLAQATTAATNPPALLTWFPDTDDCPPPTVVGQQCGTYPDGRTAEGIGPRDLAVAGGNGQSWMYVVGEFTHVYDSTTTPDKAWAAQESITRFAGPGVTSPATAAPTGPTFTATASPTDAGKVRLAWRSGWDRDSNPLTYRVYRDRGPNDPSPNLIATVTAPTSSWFWDRPQLSYVDSPAPGQHDYWVVSSDGTASTTAFFKPHVTAVGTVTPYARTVLSASPTFYLRYDDDTNEDWLSDASASNNGLTIVNNVTGAGPGATSTAIPGNPSAALTLAGNYGATSYTETRFAPPTTYSLETWFKAGSGASGKLIGFGSKQAFMSVRTDRMLWLQNGAVYFGVGGASACVAGGTNSTCFADGLTYDHELASVDPSPATPAAGGLDDGSWHHVVATEGPAGMALYVDGALVASNSAVANLKYNGYWHVGGDAITGGWRNRPASCTNKGGCPFTGTLDETAVYPGVLTATQVAGHFWFASMYQDDPTKPAVVAPPAAPGIALGPLPTAAVSGVQALPFTTTNPGDAPLWVDLYVNGATQPVSSVTCSGTASACETSTLSLDTSRYGGPISLVAVLHTASGATATSAPATLYVSSGTKVVLTLPASVKAGVATSLGGRVTATSGGAGAPYVYVRLTATPKLGTASPSAVTVLTNASGYFATPFKLPTTTVLRAAVLGTASPKYATRWWGTSATSATALVTAPLACTRSASSVRSGGYVTIRCTSPLVPTGTRFTVMKLVSGHWQSTGIVGTASKGVMTAKVRLTGRGTKVWLRFLVAASSRFTSTYGPIQIIAVT